ncbi:hypothetical protein H0E84_15050 [Luteimonas sp. SJ-92]|uniref:Uncharacterized protein n=1 Tax=Luteimonas salinisoli TaxID=2752307 RepID=A0A853JGK3_9GAMM|nr:hypothetical protein [Luteimonas salinisoli]NZA27697.1 hypothetical protein [Luteimonas salinisoli]
MTKANEMLLIPWEAIASFRVSRTVLPGALLLKLHSGEGYAIALASSVRPAEITKELAEMTGAQA